MQEIPGPPGPCVAGGRGLSIASTVPATITGAVSTHIPATTSGAVGKANFGSNDNANSSVGVVVSISGAVVAIAPSTVDTMANGYSRAV